GTVWAIPLTGLAKEGVGWTGIFDWATLWPAICELLKFIASTFHLGPYSERFCKYFIRMRLWCRQ
ncbi:hypothetical protein FGX36_19085, partial [Salmonella enterica subsp. enterica serovar Heidelberg]